MQLLCSITAALFHQNYLFMGNIVAQQSPVLNLCYMLYLWAFNYFFYRNCSHLAEKYSFVLELVLRSQMLKVYVQSFFREGFFNYLIFWFSCLSCDLRQTVRCTFIQLEKITSKILSRCILEQTQLKNKGIVYQVLVGNNTFNLIIFKYFQK